MTRESAVSKISFRAWVLALGYILVFNLHGLMIAASWPFLLSFPLAVAGYVLIQWVFDKSVKRVLGEIK